MIKLRFIGKIHGVEHLKIDTRLWDVFAPGRIFNHTTLSITGLIENGIIKPQQEALRKAV